ncbi:MAG: hypothetical protein ACYSX0_17190 [Planctomycetota bacterium]
MTWRDVERITKDIISGMTEEEATKAKLHDKPMMVYVYDANDEEERYAVEQDRNFTKEKVAIGARFFDRMRIDSECALEDRLFKQNVGRLPALYFLRPNYEVVSVMRGKFSSGKVFRTMCETMKKDYSNCVSTVLKKQREIMKDRVAMDKDRTKVERLNQQIADEKSARRRKSMIKERDAIEQRLSETEGKLRDREEALYVLAAKAKKNPA